MATGSVESNYVVTITTTPSSSSTNLITINVAAQLPLKLTSLNYFSWRTQFNSLFYGLDLLGFLDGSTPCPAPTLVNNGVPSPNLAYTLWMRQDQLILHDILVFISEIAVPMVSSAKTRNEAWARLDQLCAKKSCTHIIYLKDKLSLITRGTKTVAKFMLSTKTLQMNLQSLVPLLVMKIFFWPWTCL